MGLNLESILDKILLSIIGLVVSAIFGFIIAFITKKCKKGKNKHDDEAEADCEQNVPLLKLEENKDLNKLDFENCPTRLSINWKGYGKRLLDSTVWFTNVCAISPVPKFDQNVKTKSIYCYFEVTIVELSPQGIIDFYIGFCDEQLSMKMQIRKDYSFKPKDVISVGIGMFGNHHLNFFGSHNGYVYFLDNLQESFDNFQPLYPAVKFAHSIEHESLIRPSFEPGEWRYDPLELIE